MNDAAFIQKLGCPGLITLGIVAPGLVAAEDKVMTKDSEARAILDSVRVPESQHQKNKQLGRLYWEDFIQPYMGQTCTLAACHGGNRAGRLHFERPLQRTIADGHSRTERTLLYMTCSNTFKRLANTETPPTSSSSPRSPTKTRRTYWPLGRVFRRAKSNAA